MPTGPISTSDPEAAAETPAPVAPIEKAAEITYPVRALLSPLFQLRLAAIPA
ncbi:hypothetical protein D3C78_874510 [compost metagenome]